MDRKEELKYEIESAEEAIKYFENKAENNKKVKKRLETELEKIEQEESQEWELKYGDNHWFVDLDKMRIQNSDWINSNIDNTRLKHKVIFKTKDKVEEYLEYLKAKEKAMNEFSDEEWKDSSIIKEYIGYGYVDKEFYVSGCFFNRELNVMYFRDEEQATEFIKKYEKFMRRELGV